MKKRFVHTIIFCLHFFIGFAQDPVHTILDGYNGLPGNTVYDIMQDNRGYIWIAHDKGLSRYDGVVIKNFRNSAVQSKGLSNIMFTNKGVVYCQDFTGKFYYVQGDSLIPEKELPASGNYGFASINNNNEMIIPDALEGLKLYNLDKKTIITYKNKGAFLYYSENGNGYLTGDSIYLFNQKKMFIPVAPKYTESGYTAMFFGGRIVYVPFNSDHPVVTAHPGGWSRFFILPKGFIILKTLIIKDEIWLLTTTGAFVMDTNFRLKYNGFCFFKNSSISKIIADQEGNYWFGTLEQGLLFVPDLSSRLYDYGGLSINSLGIDPKQDQILLGTSRSDLLSFDPKHPGFRLIYKARQAHSVNHIFSDKKNGEIYISAYNLIGTQPGIAKPVNIAAVKNIAKIGKELYAFSQSGGYGFFFTKSNTAPDWLNRISQTWTTANTRVVSKEVMRCRWVDFDSATQNLYAVTSLGIYYHNPAGSGKLKWKNQDIFASSLVAKNGRLFIATFNDGLLMGENNNIAGQLNTANGLLNNNVLKVFVMQDQFAVLMENGVQVFSPARKLLGTYKKNASLPLAEYRDLLLMDSSVYIATSKGLIHFFLRNSFTSRASQIYLDNITVNNREYPFQNGIQLNPSENNLTINFSIPEFAFKEDIEVVYRINSGTWLTLDKGTRYIHLPAMQAGNYVVQIQPKSDHFNNPGNQLEIYFSVKARFYQTGWFWAGIGLILLFSILRYFHIQLHQQKEKNKLSEEKLQLEQELQKSMLTSIKSQMNPHFLFNALNTIQSYIYTNDKENASIYMGKFSSLTRLILEMSNKEKVTLAEEINALELYLELEKQRFAENLEYTISVDPAINRETTLIPSMLIQPYLENAIKHGFLHKKGIGRLKVEFTKHKDQVRVTIDDNGIGRKKSAVINSQKTGHHQSFAVNANKTRLELLNRERKNPISLIITDKMDEHELPAGTTVELYF